MPKAEQDVVETQEATQEGAAPETEAAPSPVQVDEAAMEARLREKIEAEMVQRYVPPAQEEPDDEALMFSDPKAFRAKLTQQIANELRAELAPVVKTVNADRVVNELGRGVGDAGRQYLRDNLGGVSLEQLPPAIRDMAMRAARDRDREANPQRASVAPERSTASGQYQAPLDPELQAFTKYMPEDEIRQFLKDNPR